MSDETQGTTGGESADTAEAAAQTPAPGTTSVDKGLQRVIGRKDQEIADLRTALRAAKGDPTAEEQLAEAKTQLTVLERERDLARAKADAPEVADIVEALADKYGVVPDAETIASLRTRVTSARPETSGIRNANATSAEAKDEQARQDVLKNSQLW